MSCPSYQTRRWQIYTWILGPINPHTMFSLIHHDSLTILEIASLKRLPCYCWQIQTPQSSIEGLQLSLS